MVNSENVFNLILIVTGSFDEFSELDYTSFDSLTTHA